MAERVRGAHLVLIGLPGAGKTTVGRLVADRLGSRFVDLDEYIEAREGRAIREIFAADGEAAFRSLERKATEEIAMLPGLILAPGGGWVTQPELPALLRPPSRIVHLEVTPEAAVTRMGNDIAARPLLSGGDPVAGMRRLAEARAAAYGVADVGINTEVVDLKELTIQISALAESWRVGVG